MGKHSTIALGDIDQDGDIEVVAGASYYTEEYPFGYYNGGKVVIWDLPGVYDSTEIEWGSYRHDMWNTACYTKPGVTGIADKETILPSPTITFRVSPNPFTQFTEIKYQVPEDGNSSEFAIFLGIYDITGRLIYTLVDEKQRAGYYSTKWKGENISGRKVSKGVYFCQLKIGRSIQVNKKLILI